MGRDTKRDGCHPVLSQLSKDGQETVKSTNKSNAVTLALTTIRGSDDSERYANYSIARSNAPHDPLEEALQRLDAAYTDAVNMAIASYVDSGLITEDEARRIFQQKQVWQAVRI